MLTKTLLKRLEKIIPVSDDGKRYWAINLTHKIQWIDQEGYAICLRVQRLSDQDEPNSDYVAGIYHDSIKEAINHFLGA